MIASHFGRVARATTSISSCTAHLAPAATLSAQSSSFNSSQKPTQRRLSSSKASCPPDEGPNGARPSTATQATPQPSRSPTSRSNGTKQTRGRKQKESDKRAAGQDNGSKQMTSSAFDNLPSVPTTSHMHPADITLSSFFSLYRPLSLNKPIPPPTEKAVFDRIFESSTSKSKDSTDVIGTITSTIEALESQSRSQRDQKDGDLHWEVIQESPSNTDGHGHVRHLDGLPGRGKSIEEIVAGLKPFTAPAPPVPLDEAAQAKRTARKSSTDQSKVEATQDRTFKATLLVHETTDADGAKVITTQFSQPVQIPNTIEEEEDTHHHLSKPVHSGLEIRDPAPTQPFLERMRERQERYIEYREDRLQRKEDERMAISVKRQRKLKMKKHKYKKLMKRTRNLRRRLDRN